MLKQHKKGGKSLLENPKPLAAWNTKELMDLEVRYPEPDDYELIHVDICAPLDSRTQTVDCCTRR